MQACVQFVTWCARMKSSCLHVQHTTLGHSISEFTLIDLEQARYSPSTRARWEWSRRIAR